MTRERELLVEASAREREAWAREREAWARERELLVQASAREREASAREREAWAREREFLQDREATSIAELQREADFSKGLITVRSALEGIVATAFPGKTTTDALRRFCADERFQAYLETVSSVAGFSKDSLERSAKGAYGMLSETIHAGSTHAVGGDDRAVPQAVLRDKSTLYAVAAIFKFARRILHFYAGGENGILKLPSPPHSLPPSALPSAPSSAAGSDAGSPPKAPAASAEAAGGTGTSDGSAAAAPAAAAAAAEAERST